MRCTSHSLPCVQFFFRAIGTVPYIPTDILNHSTTFDEALLHFPHYISTPSEGGTFRTGMSRVDIWIRVYALQSTDELRHSASARRRIGTRVLFISYFPVLETNTHEWTYTNIPVVEIKKNISPKISVDLGSHCFLSDVQLFSGRQHRHLH